MAERHPGLGPVLRRHAERHVPDREAMLARVARRRTEPRGRWAFTALRPVAVAASVVATLVIGFAVIEPDGDRTGVVTPAASGNRSVQTPTAAAVPPTVVAVPSGASAVSSAPSGSRTEQPGGSTPAAVTSRPRFRPSDAFLRSEAVVDSHSNETWAQGNLNLHTTAEITALDLVISIARTDGVEDAGRWTTVPTEMITMTVRQEKNVLLYRFTLNPGRTLAPGDYVFAAQYLRAGGKRDAGSDTYGVVAAGGTETAEVTGAFRGH